MTGQLIYVSGDASRPNPQFLTVPGFSVMFLAHVCNDAGRFEAGFAKAIADRYPVVRDAFLTWANHPDGDYRLSDYCDVDDDEVIEYRFPRAYQLGAIQTVSMIGTQMTVVNMVAQRGLPSARNPQPLRLGALDECLESLGSLMVSTRDEVHMPRIGTGLARGKWAKIEPIIRRNLVDKGRTVVVYDLPTNKGDRR